MLSNELETFLLYYVCWREHEINLREMRSLLLEEIQANGISKALEEFKELRMPYRKEGDHRTYYKIKYEKET